jgi:PAS domain S-box-containing protein
MTRFSLIPRRYSRFGPSLPTKTLAGFCIAISATVVVGLLSYLALRANTDSADRVTHSLKVLEQLQLLLSTVEDAETSQRGFLLTGDEKYLRPYTKAHTLLAGEIASARVLMAIDPEQARRLQAFDQLCGDKMAELAQTIALQRQGNTTGALAIVETDRGMKLMQGIRAITAEMTGEERRALAISQPKSLRAVRVSSLVTLGGAALVLAFIVAAALRTSRDNRLRQIQCWIRAGQVGLTERLHDEPQLEQLAERALGFLTQYMRARTGAVYLVEADGRLRRLAAYAVAAGMDLDLVGESDAEVEQAAKENRVLHVQRVSARRGKPTELLVAPASVDGVVHAVVALSFSRRTEAPDRELLSRLSQSLGAAVRWARDRTRPEVKTAIVEQQKSELSMFEGAAFSSIATDATGVIQIFNVGSERMLGYAAEEVLNRMTPADISDPQDLMARAQALSAELGSPVAPGFDALVAKASRGIEDNFELTYIRKDGSRFPAVLSVTAQRDADGAIVGYLLIGTDNTARKQAEEALLKAGALQSAIFNNANFSCIATDTRGIIQIFNVGAERMLGYAATEVVNQLTPAGLSDPQDVAARAATLSAELGTPLAPGFATLVIKAARGIEDIYELTYIRKDGSRFPALVSVTALRDAQDAIIGFLLIGTDNTARKQIEADQTVLERSLREATHRAEHANRAKSEFLANMSHEIRTPLNAVIGLGYLLEHTSLSEDQRQLLTKIQFGGRALLGVINNVLDLSKIEAGEMLLEEAPFDLPELVHDLSQMLAPQAAARGTELIVQSAPTLPRMVNGDASRLRQILTNLLGNAIKFTEGGQVELKVFCTEQTAARIRLRCTVQDNGIGIEPAAIERLFTPFTQADASTTRRFGGTGLGLSIARRFVDMMGGEIGVTSTLAVGSTFWIEIPLRTSADADDTHGARGLRLLIAASRDDAPDGLVAMVRALGWSTQAVDGGEQLLQVMSNTQPDKWPDVLIVERQLHDMDAPQLIARLKKQHSHDTLPPVIVVGDFEQSYGDVGQLMRRTDVLLIRPLTSSALFNAVDAATAKRPDNVERLLQVTTFDDRNAKWLAGVHVLVVDDSDINLEVARRILETQGALVTTCSDGLAAVQNVRANHEILDVVLMDVQMPILDGNEATRRIRREVPVSALPIVALTAGALVGERQRALEAGMNDFISKPFDPPALIRKVRRVVEAARGEPIPVIILDAKCPSVASPGPLMPSLDAGIVKQMFGDDRALFKSLLARVLRDFADLALPIVVASGDPAARSHLKARAHKLRGSAGVIGATRIMRLAGEAEEALAQDRPGDIVEGILRQVATALTSLREEAELMSQRDAEVAAGTHHNPAAPPAVGAGDIDELRALLASQNIAALDRFELLSASLSALLGASRFAPLRDAIHELDFQVAAELLRQVGLEEEATHSVEARHPMLSQ